MLHVDGKVLIAKCDNELEKSATELYKIAKMYDIKTFISNIKQGHCVVETYQLL